MAKSDLFDGCLKEQEFTLLNGKKIKLHEITARDRGKLQAIDSNDIMGGHAQIVILGCDSLNDKDVSWLPDKLGKSLQEMADVVIELSGLGADAKDEAKKA
jgi:uncharacterized protein YbaP (TraB family)